MAYDESLAERIRGQLSRKKNIEEKKMFGGIGFLPNGNMLTGIWKDSLIVRIDPRENAEALSEPHAREFDITGRPMKGWLLVGPEGTESSQGLKQWIDRAFKFVRTLPPK